MGHNNPGWSRRAAAAASLALLSTIATLPAAAAEPPPSTAREPGTPPRETDGRTVDLRPRFRAGREVRFQLDMTSANRLKSAANPELDGDQNLSQSFVLKLKTVEITEEGATMELVYERIKATLETAGFKATFDSGAPAAKPGAKPATSPTPTTSPRRNSKPATAPASKPAPDPADADMSDLLAQIMRPMVGTKLTMKVDRDGNIRSVSGGEALAGQGLSGLEGLLGGAGGLSGLGGLGGVGGGIALPTGGASAAGPMNWVVTGPAQRPTVRVGESWTNNDALAGTPVGGFSMVTRHTCRSAGATSANFTFTGRADAASPGGQNDSPPPGLPGGFSLKDSNYGGTYVWDTGRGELKEMTATLNTRIEQGSGKDAATSLSAETRINVRRLD